MLEEEMTVAEETLSNLEQIRVYSGLLQSTKSFIHILPDTEGEFPLVIEIDYPKDTDNVRKWIDLVSDAYAEYYRDTDYCDENDISPIDLVLNCVVKHKIPLLRYWDSVKVHQLNLRWLRKQ